MFSFGKPFSRKLAMQYFECKREVTRNGCKVRLSNQKGIYLQR